jgi:hypothetical protein
MDQTYPSLPDPSLQRAFVATLYMLGERGASLDRFELGPEARTLLRALGDPNQETRALALAREVAQIALALERGELA